MTHNPFGERVRVCDRHMERMKTAIRDGGLWHRVSINPQALAARLAKRDPYDPDPLLVLHGMVMGKARHAAVVNDVMLVDQCPVCYFGVSGWIEEAAAAVKARLVKLDAEKIADQERSRAIEEAQR